MGSHSSATLTARSRTPARLLSGRKRTASLISKHWSSSRFAKTAMVLISEGSSNMQYRTAPLFCRPWTLNGISPRLIESHYEHNYGGTVARLNAITRELATLDLAPTPGDAISRLKRDQVAALAGDLAGGSGWVLLSYVPRDGCLVNHAGADHNQTVAGAIPILALDMYEHAYQLEFGANATSYVATFMRNIDWAAVLARYEDAMKVGPPRPLKQKQFADVPAVTVEELKAMLA